MISPASRNASIALGAGVLRGALEMVQMRVECTLTKDALWGDEVRLGQGRLT